MMEIVQPFVLLVARQAHQRLGELVVRLEAPKVTPHPARAHIRKPASFADRATDAIAAFAGSWPFVWLHAVWFTLWIMLPVSNDMLTLAVSLEAIFLSTFVMMNQNRQAAKDHIRDDTEAAEVAQLTVMNEHQLELLDAIHNLTAQVRAYVEQEQTTKTTRKVVHFS